MLHFLVLFLPGILGGMINAIAGGGGIVMYPALLAVGLNPLIANATSSLVVLPGSATSAFGYRKELKKVPKQFFVLLIPCFVGAMIGAFILVNTQATTFEKLAPWLVLSAVLLLGLQTRIHHWLTLQSQKRKLHWHTLPLLVLAALPLATYGGFFGVGFGLMMLALLGFASLKNIYQMNGMKNLCGVTMTIVAVTYFTRHGLINYSSGLVMAAGTGVGGYMGAQLSQKISAHLVHKLTVAIGLVIAIILIVRS